MPWWNPELTSLRKESRSPHRITANHSFSTETWEAYKVARRAYEKALRVNHSHCAWHDLEIQAVVTSELIERAVWSFGEFKSAGPNEIFPELLQKALNDNDLYPHLVMVLRACLQRGYVPKQWREMNFVFIPKPGKDSYQKAS